MRLKCNRGGSTDQPVNKTKRGGVCFHPGTGRVDANLGEERGREDDENVSRR